jgi:phosphoenolpyruvate synthase/pyruvate phosphate dikinase
MEFIREFGRLKKDDSRIAGGKGASLGELTQIGLSVPPGFVVLASAFEWFLRDSELVAPITSHLEQIQPIDDQSIKSAAENIQKLIFAAEIPQDVESEIKEHFRKLNAPLVAVRSSATVEDSASASWAGMFDTYLNTTENDLLHNVKRCWASLFNSRAISYRCQQGLQNDFISMGVVVQTMVQSEYAGTAFSVHPVTKNADQILIEAVSGLGEQLVSGLVTPDSYLVEKKSHKIVEKIVSTKNEGSRSIFPKQPSRPILDDELIQQLGDIVQRIEIHYRFPCDIEWAYQGSVFYVVQSRPITTLTPRSGDGVPSPLDPHAELWQWGPIPVKLFQVFTACLKGNFLDFSAAYPLYELPTLLLLAKEQRLVWLHEAEKLRACGVKLFLDQILPPQKRKENLQHWSDARAELNNIEAELAHAEWTKIADKEFISLWMKFHRAIDSFWMRSTILEFANFYSPELLQDELEPYVPASGCAGAMEVLLAPERATFYREAEIDLAEAMDITAYQQKYFWIDNSYLGVSMVSAKSFVERKGTIPHTIREDTQKRLADAQQQKKAIAQKYHIPAKVLKFAQAITECMEWQDDRKREIWIYLHYDNVLLDEAISRFRFRKEDITSLTPMEFSSLMETGKCTVDFAARKKAVGILIKDGKLAMIDNPLALKYWSLYVDVGLDPNMQELKGVLASRGQGSVTGKVRLVFDPMNASTFETGDILVTTMTSPEYINLIDRAAAIVTDTGGMTCHAATAARERGKLCIVNTKNATRLLKDGDQVEVNSDTQSVRLLSGSQSEKQAGV